MDNTHLGELILQEYCGSLTLEGDDSVGADSGRLRGGIGGGMWASSTLLLQLIIEEIDADPVT